MKKQVSLTVEQGTHDPQMDGATPPLAIGGNY